MFIYRAERKKAVFMLKEVKKERKLIKKKNCVNVKRRKEGKKDV